jgi:hypothetical protein
MRGIPARRIHSSDSARVGYRDGYDEGVRIVEFIRSDREPQA